MSRGRTGFIAVCFLAFVVVGVGLERVRQAVLAPAPSGAESAPPSLSPPRALAPDAAPAVDELRKRIAELERELAARQERPAARGLERLPEAERGDGDWRRGPFRGRGAPPEESRTSYFAAVDTRAMTPAQRENHDRLLATLAAIDELQARRDPVGGESRDALRERIAELAPLYEAERAYLLQQAARAAGYEGEAAENFIRNMCDVMRNTTPPRGPLGDGPSGPGGPPRVREP